MNLKLKKVNNQIYIVDVDAEINSISSDNLFYNHKLNNIEMTSHLHITVSEPTILEYANDCLYKVIATTEQIDIDNLWDKYLEALAEKEYPILKEGSVWMSSFVEFAKLDRQKAYIKAKKETSFSESDMIKIFCDGFITEGIDSSKFKTLSEYALFQIQQVKLSKIPDECGVEVEMQNATGSALLDGFIPMPKLTKDKVTITKIIL